MKNGVGKHHSGFTPWFWSYRLPAKFEAVVVGAVFAGVIAILALLFRMPGPLLVHVQDDKKEPIQAARVTCTAPDGASSHSGTTDVFGETKWPGLAKGAWKCDVTPPDRFHAPVQTGYVTVVPRKPAMWTAVVQRPGQIVARVVRPQGQPRAKVAVRAVCGAETWEARGGVLDGLATLFVPPGKPCRVGLVRPELPGDGPVTDARLDCSAAPCAPEVIAGVGERVEVVLTPNPEQWATVRPAPEPDSASADSGRP